MPRARTWSWFPERLLSCSRYLALDPAPCQLLHRLYATADRWGRFPADGIPCALHAKVLRTDAGESLEVLESAGLIETWASDDGNRYGELVSWDSDGAPLKVAKNRSPSRFPRPDVSGQTADVSGQTPPVSGQHRESGGFVPRAREHGTWNMERGSKDPRPTRAPDAPVEGQAGAAIAAFVEEYQRRLGGGALFGAGRRGPGFFGRDGAFEVEAQLRELWETTPKIAEVVCRRFWEELDSDGADLSRGIEVELERCAVRHGRPSGLAQVLAAASLGGHHGRV